MTANNDGSYSSTFKINGPSLYFTFIQTPPNFSVFNANKELCDQQGGEIEFIIIGEDYDGQNLLLTQSDLQFKSNWNIQQASFAFTNLPFGKYTVALEDQPGSILQTIEFKEEDCDVVNDGEFLLFPNPISNGNVFTLQLPENTGNNASIEIHDHLGRIIKRQMLGSDHGNIYQDKINTEGTYSIVLKDGQVNKVFQLIVINE